MLKKRIYLDYASLTPVDPRVLREVAKYSNHRYANPSSLYQEGVSAKKALEDSRKRVAQAMNAHPDEIVFTSGGTESNSLAIEGCLQVAKQHIVGKPHLIISSIEHSSVMETANVLEEQGVEVTRLSVDSRGLISLQELREAIKSNTYMVSVMMVNNELGTIQPIRDIAKVIRQVRSQKSVNSSGFESSFYPLLHTDGAQALYEDINMEKLGVDMLTLDSSKMYGPRGVGALFVRRGTPIFPIILGGGQEGGLRSGTENIPGIMGFAKAIDILIQARGIDQEKDNAELINREKDRLIELKTYFIKGLLKIDSNIVINSPVDSSPHILNISIPDIDNEFLVLNLDVKGVACSTKSSCLHDQDESYVLRSVGVDSRNSVRFSFGRWTKKADLDKVLHILKLSVKLSSYVKN